ncbi:unknown [Fusobacterium sp. CAG:439]|nr:unknown [Fusobacterium sp. CAG:439]
MIGAVKSLVTSSQLANIAQNTTQSVAIETTLKSIGRPGFILIDKDIDSDTKQYAAAKEFLYQATCLAVYMALIVPVFKKGGFKIAKNHIFKNTEGFEHFKDVKEYMHYRKLADNPSLNNRLKTLEKEKLTDKTKIKDKYNGTLLAELNKEKPEKFAYVKGAVELSNIIGSVLGLAILAPQVSHAFIHPALRFLGLEDKKAKEAQQTAKLDTKA